MTRNQTNDDGRQESIDDDLAGLYAANVGHSDTSAYPPGVAHVYVAEPKNDYHDVVLFDADGAVVAQGNRPRYRIEAALSGGDGYDVLVGRVETDA